MLDKPDSSGTPLLHKSITARQVDIFPLLLAIATNPGIESPSNLTTWDVLQQYERQLGQFLFQQMRDLLDYQVVCWLHPHGHVRIAANRYFENFSRQSYPSPSELWKYR